MALQGYLHNFIHTKHQNLRYEGKRAFTTYSFFGLNINFEIFKENYKQTIVNFMEEILDELAHPTLEMKNTILQKKIKSIKNSLKAFENSGSY